METLATHEHKLTLSELLGMLVADGQVSQAVADAMVAERRSQRQNVHPLATIAGQNWKIAAAAAQSAEPGYADRMARWARRPRVLPHSIR